MARPEWRVIVADDEPAARRGVRQLLAAFPAFQIVSECRNGSEVLAALDSLQAHLLFLDIQMPGIDGFEVIRRRTPQRMPRVVFLTAYDEFALQAFEVEALDYLVKPVSEERFAATMRRVARQLGGDAGGGNAVIAVAGSRGTTIIRLGEIDWFEAADNYVRIWTGGRSLLLREAMRSLERRIRGHGFVRAHRGALVRVASVRRLTRDADGSLTAVLSTGARVPVSRRRRAAFVGAVRGVG